MKKVLGVDISSSVDPQKISLTIKGFGTAMIPAVIAIAGLFGFQFVEADLVQFVNAVASIASMVMIIYGVARKYYVKFR